jgi:nucleoside-diphosphate-sugar epimerase
MNILITGGAGFIGYHMACFHAERGDRVFILDNFFKTECKSDKEFETLTHKQNVDFFQVDLTRSIGNLEIPETLDIVYHLASINGTRLFYEMPYRVARTNLLVTLNLLDWLESKSVKRLVYSSTSEVYADSEKIGMLTIPTNESALVAFTQPTNVRFSYGTSKFMGELLCLQFSKLHKISASVVRYHNIYGPRMGNKHVIPEFIDRLVSQENPFKIYGGTETRAFCYVADVVRANYLVATSQDCDDEIIHIGNSEEEITIEDVARLMMDILGKKVDITECGRRSGSVSRRCPDTTKLQTLTGFKAEVNLREGLKRTIDWCLSPSRV